MMFSRYAKRAVFALGLILVALFAFGQDYIEDMDGFDWVQMTWGERAAYVQGFYAAYSSLAERSVMEAGGYDMLTEEDMSFIDEYFFIDITVGEMVQRLTEFYSDYNNRKYPLYVVLMTYAGKDYWSTSDFYYQEERSSSRS